ncbi:hypothetical protein CROQUDRAFT_434018 [Cronartium quercuum f. sp. fusiforme G11]|uniref:Uncharacterized protein n=1 Tax=Cronartium quercuum f. sp. fusiforme G11 TaxID=708437 RepID=A0A9P6NJ74_9BASI|nr:hypothetical protein CROQUDRAFT_434018 [Cronartium quercuum f. sp. fusiforme G11]
MLFPKSSRSSLRSCQSNAYSRMEARPVSAELFTSVNGGGGATSSLYNLCRLSAISVNSTQISGTASEVFSGGNSLEAMSFNFLT